MIIETIYTSVFDDSIVCKSKCKFNTETRTVCDIEDADNSEEADDANGLTDEFITLDNHDLREIDGITFDY